MTINTRSKSQPFFTGTLEDISKRRKPAAPMVNDDFRDAINPNPSAEGVVGPFQSGRSRTSPLNQGGDREGTPDTVVAAGGNRDNTPFASRKASLPLHLAVAMYNEAYSRLIDNGGIVSFAQTLYPDDPVGLMQAALAQRTASSNSVPATSSMLAISPWQEKAYATIKALGGWSRMVILDAQNYDVWRDETITFFQRLDMNNSTPFKAESLLQADAESLPNYDEDADINLGGVMLQLMSNGVERDGTGKAHSSERIKMNLSRAAGSSKASALWQAAKRKYSPKNTMYALGATKAPAQGSQTGAAYLHSFIQWRTRREALGFPMGAEAEMIMLINGLNVEGLAYLPHEWGDAELEDVRMRIQNLPSGSKCTECKLAGHATRNCPSVAKLRRFPSRDHKSGSGSNKQNMPSPQTSTSQSGKTTSSGGKGNGKRNHASSAGVGATADDGSSDSA